MVLSVVALDLLSREPLAIHDVLSAEISKDSAGRGDHDQRRPGNFLESAADSAPGSGLSAIMHTLFSGIKFTRRKHFMISTAFWALQASRK